MLPALPSVPYPSALKYAVIAPPPRWDIGSGVIARAAAGRAASSPSVPSGPTVGGTLPLKARGGSEGC